MDKAEFDIRVQNIDQEQFQELKECSGTPDVSGCHATLVNSNALEDDVPASDIDHLLAERPASRFRAC